MFATVFYASLPRRNVWCAVIFAGAALTDWLDGYIARKQGIVTPFGAFLDPVADKVTGAGTPWEARGGGGGRSEFEIFTLYLIWRWRLQSGVGRNAVLLVREACGRLLDCYDYASCSCAERFVL